MPPKAAPPRPKAGQQRHKPVQRQYSDRTGSSPGPRAFRASTPVASRQATPGISVAPNRRPNRTCRACSNPDIVLSDELSWVCRNCGTLAEEDPNLVIETTFSEAPGGKMAPQGVQISHNQTHQKTYGQGLGLGSAGREITANREKSEREARQIMQNYCIALKVEPLEIDTGMRIFNLAWSHRFIQGRGLENTVAVSLYLALRKRQVQEFGITRPKYAIMLIDLAELLNVDVFALGKMYTDLVRKLYLDTTTGGINEHESKHLLAYGPEVLVDKFVDALHFETDSRKVKEDAIKIVSRMKRDWMSTGRRPAGVCGAAIILAARMNNHRRTTREVILIAKVTEITLNKRLEEFKDLPSSSLSINDFRNPDILGSIAEADPPSFTQGLNPKVKKSKRGRPRKNVAPDTAAEIEGQTADTVQADEPPAKRPRLDAEGFAIPDIPLPRTLPIDPSLLAEGEPLDDDNDDDDEEEGEGEGVNRSGPGRRKGSKNWRAPPPTAAELAIEAELERDVLQTLADNPELDPNYQPSAGTGAEGDSESSAPQQQQASSPPTVQSIMPPIHVQSRKDPLGPPVNTNIGNTGIVSLSPNLRPEEFDDDPEVSICLLSETERQLKEIVWVNANADWLRQDHAKRIKKELKDAELREKGIDPAALEAQQGRKGMRKRKDGTRRAGRLGDVSYLNDPERPGQKRGAGDGAQEGGADDNADETGEAGTGSVAESAKRDAAEAVRKMLSHRGTWSRKVNYDIVDRLYGINNSSPGSSHSRSRSRSMSASQSQREESVAAAADASDDDDSAQLGIFGGRGSKDSGLLRSKSSLAAERREQRKRDQRERASGTGSATPAAGASLGTPQRATPPSIPGKNIASSASKPTTITPRAVITPAAKGREGTVEEDDDEEILAEETESQIQPRASAELLSRPTSTTGKGEDDLGEESEGDEDDYIEDEGEEDIDVDLEGVFGGKLSGLPGHLTAVLGEEEVVEDDD